MKLKQNELDGLHVKGIYYTTAAGGVAEINIFSWEQVHMLSPSSSVLGVKGAKVVKMDDVGKMPSTAVI